MFILLRRSIFILCLIIGWNVSLSAMKFYAMLAAIKADEDAAARAMGMPVESDENRPAWKNELDKLIALQIIHEGLGNSMLFKEHMKEMAQSFIARGAENDFVAFLKEQQQAVVTKSIERRKDSV